MKKFFLIVALFLVSSAVTDALELVPKPAKMWQGTQEVRLRSTEPVVEITTGLQFEVYNHEITEDGHIVLKAGSLRAAVWGRHTVEQLLAQARRKGKNIWLPTLRIEDKPVFPYQRKWRGR